MTMKEEQRKEALKRLDFLAKNGMSFKEPIKAFEKGSVGIFENLGAPFRATYYDLYLNKGDERYDKIIDAKETFESEFDSVVYLIQITHTDIGELVSMFYVSESRDSWEWDKQDLKEGITCADVYNLDDEYADLGNIQFAYDKSCGGIYRVA